MLALRDYQTIAIHQVFAAWRGGARSVVLVAPTGCGKRVMALWLMDYAAKAGRRVLFVGNRRLLVTQAQNDAGKYEIPHGVIMADSESGDPASTNQLASIQTLESWYFYERFSSELTGHGLPGADLVVVDEVHTEALRYRQLLDLYPRAKFLGLTATPVGTEGISIVPQPYDVLVEPIKNSELIAQEYLLPTVVYAPSEPNIEGVKIIKRGEYNQAQLGRAVQECTVFADVFTEWDRHAGDRATVAFVPGIPYGRDLVHQFNQRLGPGSAHLIEAKTKHHEREAAFDAVESGKSKVLVSCNVLCLDSQTEILTARGFVGINDFAADDLAANWHKPEHWSQRPKITFERPVKVFHRPRGDGEAMAVLATKCGNIRITADHTVVWRSSPNCYYRTSSAGELAGKHIDIPVCGVSEPAHVEIEQPLRIAIRDMQRLVTKTSYNLRKVGLDTSKALADATSRIIRKYTLRRKNPHELSLDECRFAGFWIGDGVKASLIKGGLEYYVTSSLVYPNIIRWFDGVCERMGYDYKRNTYHNRDSPHVKWAFSRGTGGGSQERNGIFSIEHFLDKHLDALLWALNEDQFDAFIEGFWYAEGNHGKAERTPDKGWLVSNADYGLLSVIQAVAVCRGWRARLRQESPPRKPHHRQVWKLNLRKTQDAAIGLRPQHALQIEDVCQEETVWCIKSTSGFIITRRGGVVTVLGNCEGWDLPVVSCALDLQPNSQLRWYWQKLGRIKRPYGEQKEAIYLDFAGNYWKFTHPNQDPEWPQGEQTTQDAIKAARQAGTASQPIMCPKCHLVRERGPVCPQCGYKCPDAIRRIRMGNGQLREISAVEHAKREKSESEKLYSKWQSQLYGALHSGRTFGQAVKLYHAQVGEYPRDGWPCVLPHGHLDLKRRVKDQFTPRDLAILFRRSKP